MSGQKSVPEIPDHVIESLARCILPAIQKYFESEEGQREFEKWKEVRDNKVLDMKNNP